MSFGVVRDKINGQKATKELVYSILKKAFRVNFKVIAREACPDSYREK